MGGVIQRYNNATERWEMVVANLIPSQGVPILPVPFARAGTLALSTTITTPRFPVPYRCYMSSVAVTATALGGNPLSVAVNVLRAAGGTTNYLTGSWTPAGGVMFANFGAPSSSLPLVVNDLVSVSFTTGASATLWADVLASLTFVPG